MVFACVRFANVNVKGLRRVQRLTKYVVGGVGEIKENVSVTE